MKALIYRDGGLRVDEAAAPEPAEGQIVVKTLACGICGSDLHFVHHAPHAIEVMRRIGGPFDYDLSRDIVLGHEFCGEVMETGSAPDSHKAGTQVCSMPFAFADGRVQPLGFSADRPGGFAQYMALNTALLVPVPNGLPPALAALTEPMAVGLHAVNRGKVSEADVALVIGCGPIGLAVIAALKVAGVRDIIAADFSASRRALAEKMGASLTVDPALKSPYASWQEVIYAGGHDPDSLAAFLGMGPQARPAIVFECVGSPGMLQRVFEGAIKGTRVIVVGVCMEVDRFEPLFPIARENDVHFSYYYSPDEFALALRLLAEGQIDGKLLLSDTVGLGEAPAAFDRLSGGAADIKVMVDPWI